jgi:CheY-like chemotaxis protein
MMDVPATNEARTVDPLGEAEGDRDPSARPKLQKPVLVVDDNEDIREAMLAALEGAGYAAKGASDGAEALAMLRQDGLRPCLILLDLMMPVMDGFAFRDQQLRYPSLAEIPVVVISAFGRETAARALGIADYLAKPIEIDRLLQLVEQHCAQ